MGGLVESQVVQAVHALSDFNVETAGQVLQQEVRVNRMEVEIDRDLSAIIARRQPTARDLRLLIAVSKAIANLERVGDDIGTGEFRLGLGENAGHIERDIAHSDDHGVLA